jgi:hypothetical protein
MNAAFMERLVSGDRRPDSSKPLKRGPILKRSMNAPFMLRIGWRRYGLLRKVAQGGLMISPLITAVAASADRLAVGRSIALAGK